MIEDVRLKLSALWICRMLIGFLGDVLRFLEPGMLEELSGGGAEGMEVTGGLLLVSAAIFVLPIAMVFLSLTLPYRVNRWANIVLAVFILGFDLVGLPTYGAAYSVFLIVVGLVFNALTVWYAWRWSPPAASPV